MFMTPQVALNALDSNFIRGEDVLLLIVDEAHHCMGNDPSARLCEAARRKGVKRIFGMTASPGMVSTGPCDLGGGQHAPLCTRGTPPASALCSAESRTLGRPGPQDAPAAPGRDGLHSDDRLPRHRLPACAQPHGHPRHRQLRWRRHPLLDE